MVDFASRMVEHYPESADPLAEPAVRVVDEIDEILFARREDSAEFAAMARCALG